MNKMKKRKTFLRFAAAALSVISLAAFTACDVSAGPINSDVSGKVMLLCKNKNIEFWSDIARGAEEAGSEIGLDVTVVYGESETDTKSQLEQLDKAKADGFKAIIIAPNTPSNGDFSDINNKLAEIAGTEITVGSNQKISTPIININNAIKYDGTSLRSDQVSMLIKSDDEEAGRTAAREVISMMTKDKDTVSGHGKFLVFGHASGTGNTRCNGFQDEIAQAIALEQTSQNKQGTNELSVAGEIPVSELNSIKSEHFTLFLNTETNAMSDTVKNDILSSKNILETSVIFCTNTETTEQVCKQVEGARNSGKIGDRTLSSEETKALQKLVIIGFNSSQAEISYLKSGTLDGTIIQNPYLMGYLSVRYVKQILQGKSVPTDVDPGIMYINSAKLEEEYVQNLLNASVNE